MTLAFLIHHSEIDHLLSTWGYAVVFAFVMIESLGIPFPGETTLSLAAIYAGNTHKLTLPGVIAAAAIGAIVGDNIGYGIGRYGGYRLLRRYGHYVHIDERVHLLAAELSIEKQIRESYLEVRKSDTQGVVTAVEVLSPSTKRCGELYRNGAWFMGLNREVREGVGTGCTCHAAGSCPRPCRRSAGTPSPTGSCSGCTSCPSRADRARPVASP